MESVFDRLVREISREERQIMLQKIDNSQILTEEPMRQNYSRENKPLFLDQEFAELPFFEKLKIIIIDFLTGRGRDRLTEEILLKRTRRQLVKNAPGIIDFNRNLVRPKMSQYINQIRSSMEVFRTPLVQALEGDKPAFYAFLGKMEFMEIQKRLDTEPVPDRLSNIMPEATPAEIKKQMNSLFEAILEDISPEKRRKMVNHTAVLNRLRNLVRYPYNRILVLFPRGEGGFTASASLKKVEALLLELGDALDAFHKPPSLKLLQTLFIFDFQDSIAIESEQLEVELNDRMNRASAPLHTI